MIYVIGDSHGYIFTGKDGFKVIANHAWCAHNIINPNKFDSLLRYVEQIKPEDYLILAFGEIDCRLHFHYQHKKQGVPINFLIDNTIHRYGQVMKILKELGINFAIYNIVPANMEPDFYKHYSGRYSSCPRDERKTIYREFHDRLNAFCNANGYKIVDTWDVTAAADGFIKPEYRAGDDVHLTDAAFPAVKERIYKVFGIS